MKKQILICLTVLSSALTTFAQTWSGSTPGNIYYNQGDVGINVSYPQRQLTIGGTYPTLGFKTPDGLGWLTLSRGNGDYSIFECSNTDWTQGDHRFIIKRGGNIGIMTETPQRQLTIGGTYPTLGFKTPDGLGWLTLSRGNGDYSIFECSNTDWTQGNHRLTIERGGNIGIGIENPYYKLDVNGTMRAKEVKVNLNIGGADYVFHKGYNLMPIEDLEEFVVENKHLPEIATEKEMQVNGLNISEFQIKLLQKVEELTLYTIEQNKKILELEKQNAKIKVLEEKIEKLETTLK